MLIQDGAGFHLPDGHARRPANARGRTLPADRPGLNPVEKLRDQSKDVLCPRAFESMEELPPLLTTWLANFWKDAPRACALSGRGGRLAGANASSPTI